MSRNRVLTVLLVVYLCISQIVVANAFEVVFDPELGFESEISEHTFGQKTFYSNYTNRFYVFGNDNRRIGGWDNAAWRSRWGLLWTNITYINIPVGTGYKRLLASRIDFYLEPNGRYLHFAYIETTGSPNQLWYGKLELRLNSVQPIYVNATDVQQIDTMWGVYEVNQYVSVVADASGRPWVSAQYTTGAGLDEAILLRCDQTNGTWNSHTDISFQAVYQNVIDEQIYTKLAPTGDGVTENGVGNGVHWIIEYDAVLGVGQRFVTVSGVNYDDGGGWDWDQTDMNDLVEADWIDNTWDIGYAGNYTILFKQTEDLAAPDRITISYQVREGKNNWENETIVAFEELGDAGSVRFIPLCALNENKFAVFVWTIQTPANNKTWWYRLANVKNGSFQSTIVEWKDLPATFTGDPNIAQTTNGAGFLPLNIPMSIAVADNNGGELIYHDYLFAFGDAWVFPAQHLNTTLTNENGEINDGWIFEGDIYTLTSYFTGCDIFRLNFTDTKHEIRFIFDNSTLQLYIETTGNRYVLDNIYVNYTLFDSGVQRAIWRFIPDINIIDSLDVELFYYVQNDAAVYNATATTGITFNIYNLGGFTYYTFDGDGYKVTGGHPFEIAATNGTNNGYALAYQIFRKLQHIHFLIEINFDNEWDGVNGEFDFEETAGYIDIGIDYRLNASWVFGWNVRLRPDSANIGHHNLGNDHDWIKWKVQWMNYDPDALGWFVIKEDFIYTNHWGYEKENYVPDHINRTSTQIWVDLWFDKTNASTTVGGHVNSYYHGMKEQGAAWWFGYGLWLPMRSDYGYSQFLDNLYDQNGNVTNSLDYDIMRAYVELTKIGNADADNETWRIASVQDLHIEQAIDRMQGIDTPTFSETKILDMPQGGFLGAVKAAINNLSKLIWGGALQFIKILMGAAGSLMNAIGLGDLWLAFSNNLDRLAAFVVTMMDNMQVALTNTALVLTEVFTLFTATIGRFVSLVTGFISSILSWYTGLVQLFTGGGIFSIDVWAGLSLEDWVGLGLLLLPVFWLDRLGKSDDLIGTATNDIKFVVGAITGLISFLSTVIMLTIAVLNTLIGLLPI